MPYIVTLFLMWRVYSLFNTLWHVTILSDACNFGYDFNIAHFSLSYWCIPQIQCPKKDKETDQYDDDIICFFHGLSKRKKVCMV